MGPDPDDGLPPPTEDDASVLRVDDLNRHTTKLLGVSNCPQIWAVPSRQ